MSNPSRYIAVGFYAGVRWYVERPADMVAPAVLVTLQTRHVSGLTYVSEAHECPAMNRIVELPQVTCYRIEVVASPKVLPRRARGHDADDLPSAADGNWLMTIRT